MFGPNVRGTIAGHNFHHRGEEYATLLNDLQKAFGAKWGRRFDYLFLSGSGTMANEAVMWSTTEQFNVDRAELEFFGRLKKLAIQNDVFDRYSANLAFPKYETASAQEVILNSGVDPKAFHFADCVSSLPYYDPPTQAKVWTTVGSKQLGAFPICSVVAVKHGQWKNFVDDGEYSILNLARYRTSQKKGMSPHTPAIPILQDLLERVEDLRVEEFRSFINERRATLLARVGHGEGPVVNIPKKQIRASTAKALGLYESALGMYQIFLYSEPTINFEKFCKELVK